MAPTFFGSARLGASAPPGRASDENLPVVGTRFGEDGGEPNSESSSLCVSWSLIHKSRTKVL